MAEKLLRTTVLSTYVDLLLRGILLGGRGAWGASSFCPHFTPGSNLLSKVWIKN